MAMFYKDLNKTARDILSDDYSLKRTLKMKHTTPAGLSVTSKSEHQKGVSGALEAKFFHAKSGVMVDKAKLNPDGSMGVEASMKGVAKDVKILAKVNDVLKGEMSVEVVKPKVTSTATVDVEGSWVKASSCMAIGSSLWVGADAESAVVSGKTASLKAYSVGAATGGLRWGASLTCTDRMQTYNAAGYYWVRPNVVASALASTTPEKSTSKFEAGVKYQCNPKTVVRAKVNSSGVATACAMNKCADKVAVTATAQVTKQDTTPKFGIMCTLG